MVEKQANEILTLPINQYLSDTEINKIIELINGF